MREVDFGINYGDGVAYGPRFRRDVPYPTDYLAVAERVLDSATSEVEMVLNDSNFGFGKKEVKSGVLVNRRYIIGRASPWFWGLPVSSGFVVGVEEPGGDMGGIYRFDAKREGPLMRGAMRPDFGNLSYFSSWSSEEQVEIEGALEPREVLTSGVMFEPGELSRAWQVLHRASEEFPRHSTTRVELTIAGGERVEVHHYFCHPESGYFASRLVTESTLGKLVDGSESLSDRIWFVSVEEEGSGTLLSVGMTFDYIGFFQGSEITKPSHWGINFNDRLGDGYYGRKTGFLRARAQRALATLSGMNMSPSAVLTAIAEGRPVLNPEIFNQQRLSG